MALTDNILAYWNLNNNGSGGVSIVDSTGNGYTLSQTGTVALGTGLIGGDAVFSGDGSNLATTTPFDFSGDFSISLWGKVDPTNVGFFIGPVSGSQGVELYLLPTNNGAFVASYGGTFLATSSTAPTDATAWNYYVFTRESGNISIYLNGSPVGTGSEGTDLSGTYSFGFESTYNTSFAGSIDEVGVWSRALSQSEVTELYNQDAGLTYPFGVALYYNNAEADGDWGNLLNWWQDSGFTIQATALPDNGNAVNLYEEVTQNTQGADQCFCYSASFWSANFGAGLTLQSTGVVNMQGTSIFAGTTTDGVSMHDSSQLTATSVVDGNVVMRDSSRAFGSILGNATIYYDGGNGQFPIGGTVGGSVTYIGWPAISPQWFNDQATGGADDGDFANMANWWSDETYTTRPINSVGYQQLPDASTNVFIAPDTGIYANTGDAILVNSITANNGYISNITLTVSNGIVFSGNGNYGTTNAIIYADVTFSGTAYNDGSAIHGNANYTSSASLVASFNHNSLGKLTSGASYGSNTMTVNIAGGGGGMISRLLNLPWFINI